MQFPDLGQFLEQLHTDKDFDRQTVGRIKKAVSDSDVPFDIVASELGLIAEEKITPLMSRILGLNAIDSFEHSDWDEENPVSTELMKNKEFIVLFPQNAAPELIVSDPFDTELFEALLFALESSCELKLAPRKEIRKHLLSLEQTNTNSSSDDYVQDQELSSRDLERLNAIANDAPTVLLVNEILRNGNSQNASDIHLESNEDQLKVLNRIDGELTLVRSLRASDHAAIVSRLKIMAGLNIAEQRLPQDGQFTQIIDGRSIDFRVSMVPSVQGENVVIRLLNRNQIELSFRSLGFLEKHLDDIKKLFSHRHGIVLITGPTNSGKSTTLYSALTMMSGTRGKLVSVEDPVEMEMPGVTQLQINDEIGFSFPKALRSILRHDPDVIMIGEIRDSETASIAVRAALTGHLVVASLHTNDAVSAISRLRDLGVESYLVASTLRGVIAQRLVRKLCKACRVQSNTQCKTCKGIGYSGRTVLYEFFHVTSETSSLISQDANEKAILENLIHNGMETFEKNTQTAVELGITDRAETGSLVGEFIE